MAEQTGPHGWAIELENDEQEQSNIEARAKVFCDSNVDIIRALKSRVEWYGRQQDGQALLMLAAILHNTANSIMQMNCVDAVTTDNKTDEKKMQ